MTKPLVELLTLDKNELSFAQVIAGISPRTLRRVFGSWISFVIIICILVALAPGISVVFMNMTFAIMAVFTVVIFAQSRIAEGWPTVIYYERKLGVVQDPIARSFIFVPLSVVKNVEPFHIQPNKKALAVVLDETKISEQDKETLNKAIWPHDDRLIAMTYFKKRKRAIDDINQLMTKKSVA